MRGATYDETSCNIKTAEAKQQSATIITNTVIPYQLLTSAS